MEERSNVTSVLNTLGIGSKKSSDNATTTSIVQQESKGKFDQIFCSLSSNKTFEALVGVGVLAIGVSASKKFRVVLSTAFRRRFLSTLELDNEDCAYNWVLDFINKHSTHRTNKLTVNTRLWQAESGRASTSFYFLPGRGIHYFWYNLNLIKVERTREKQSIQKIDFRTPLETVTLTKVGGNPLFWKNFLTNAAKEALSQIESGLVIYNAVGPEWHKFGNPRRKRTLSSIILDAGVREKLQHDFEEFIGSQKWYVDRGVPYRRGYLLYGPPGTGKSSFISALAGHYGYSICLILLSERTLDDARLNHLLNIAPSNSILVLEDIDAAMPSRELSDNGQDKAYVGATRVTLSGLLNAIDGVASSEERILFMTTNHKDRLDQALIRPGRVDVQQNFDYCTLEMLLMMYKRFYENVTEEMCAVFKDRAVSLKLGKTLSPAQVQGHLLLYKQDPKGAIKNLEMLCKKP